jgi:hypothetical protein
MKSIKNHSILVNPILAITLKPSLDFANLEIGGKYKGVKS